MYRDAGLTAEDIARVALQALGLAILGRREAFVTVA
jgi:hypothetical protein